MIRRRAAPSASQPLQLIVNADDFGLSDETVDATIECFEAGALTSASIMPGMPATERALAFARSRPELDFGVHLTFTGDFGGRPLAGIDSVPCLVAEDGAFLRPREVRSKALLGRLDPARLQREIEAQVRAVADAGVAVSHVDSHRHLHKFAPFRVALAQVLPRLGIRCVRSVQDVYLARRFASPTYWLAALWRDRLRGSFETTEHFYMASVGDPDWADPLLGRLVSLAGSLEVGVHPGREAWRERDLRATLKLTRELDGRARLVDWRSLGPTEGR